MIYLLQDVETTGLLDFKKDLMELDQPRICQIAATMMHEDGEIISDMSCIIKPDGWVISEEATKINGITNEMAEKCGVPIKEALSLYIAMKKQCQVRVGHAISYDKRMFARETNLCGMEHNSEGIDSFDTLQESKNIVQLPPTDKMMLAGRKDFKPPTLEEAYEYFTGKKLIGAHNARIDVIALREVFLGIKRYKNAA